MMQGVHSANPLIQTEFTQCPYPLGQHTKCRVHMTRNVTIRVRFKTLDKQSNIYYLTPKEADLIRARTYYRVVFNEAILRTTNLHAGDILISREGVMGFIVQIRKITHNQSSDLVYLWVGSQASARHFQNRVQSIIDRLKH